MKPSPYQITAFTHAARQRSFSKAAAELGVTQSSITQHVAKLERMMGAQLFVRRREGLEMTRTARDLFAVTDRLRTLEKIVEEKVGSFSTLSTGHLRLVANAPRPAMAMIARYNELYPDVRFEFSLVDWTLGMQLLHDREVDAAIITEPEPVDDLYVRDICTSRYRAYVHRDHPLAARNALSLYELQDHTLILPEDGSLTQRVVDQKVAEYELEFGRMLKCHSFPVVKEAVLHGVGVGLLLEDSSFPSTNLIAIEVEEMPEDYRICLALPADKRDLRLVESFIGIASELADR